MSKLKAKLPRKQRRAIRKQIAGYAIRGADLVKDPALLLRDPKTGVMIAASNDDVGTGERRAHDVIEREGTGQPHARVVTASQLDTMLSRKNLAFDKDDDHQRLWHAGDQLRRDWYKAGKQPRIISVLSDAPKGKGEITDEMIDAGRRCDAALAAVGPILSPVLVHVICDDRPIADAMRNKRSGHEKMVAMTLFKAALATLAIYYRY